jgi:hypothetical protein
MKKRNEIITLSVQVDAYLTLASQIMIGLDSLCRSRVPSGHRAWAAQPQRIRALTALTGSALADGYVADDDAADAAMALAIHCDGIGRGCPEAVAEALSGLALTLDQVARQGQGNLTLVRNSEVG